MAGEEQGERCREILAEVATGELDGATSTAVMEELWHLEFSRRLTGMEGQTRRAYDLLAPLLPITDETFSRALELQVESIGANDRIHAATCHQYGIATILTADQAFDELPALQRIDPLKGGALAALQH